MKKFSKIEDIVDTNNTEIVIGIKGSATMMLVDKKMKPFAEKVFTDIPKEFDTYLTKGEQKIPLFVVQPEDFSKIVKLLDKMSK